MKFNSVIPTDMTQEELLVACRELKIAKNWGLTYATISLSNGLDYKLGTDRLGDYQKHLAIITGGSRV